MIFEPFTTLAIEEISSDWRALESDWTQLWNRLSNPTPFQTFAWNAACLEAFGAEDLRILVARAPNRIVGIFPFIGAEKIRLIGGNVSDYQDALVAPGFERMVMDAVVDHLRSEPHRWSECSFENVRAESALLHGDFGPGHSDVIETDNVCPVLDLTGPTGLPTRLPQTVPPEQREKVRYYTRRIAKAGHVQFESASAENLSELLDALNSFRPPSPSPTNFLRNVTRKLYEAGALRMQALRLEQKIIGVHVGFHCGARSFSYLAASDREHSDSTPSLLLVAHAIDQALAEGATSFDFLRGGQKQKYAWGAHDTHTYCRKIVRL